LGRLITALQRRGNRELPRPVAFTKMMPIIEAMMPMLATFKGSNCLICQKIKFKYKP